MAQVTVRQALQRVADYPVMLTDEIIEVPAHELIARTLFDIANKPDAKVRGSLARSNRARKLILDRLGGKRKAGTQPAVKTKESINFIDLTQGELG
jgi:hypothetical protein